MASKIANKIDSKKKYQYFLKQIRLFIRTPVLMTSPTWFLELRAQGGLLTPNQNWCAMIPGAPQLSRRPASLALLLSRL